MSSYVPASPMIQKSDIPISLESLWAAAMVDSVYKCCKVEMRDV